MWPKIGDKFQIKRWQKTWQNTIQNYNRLWSSIGSEGPQCRQYIQIGFLTLDHWQQEKRVSLQIDGCVTLIISGENIQVLLWWRMEEGVNSFPWPDGWKELQTKADLLSELIGSAESGGNEMRSKDGQQNARRRRRTKYCSTLGADQCDQIGLL